MQASKLKTIRDAQERLAYYDSSVGRFEAAQKSGEVVTVSKTAIEKGERDAFGFNLPSLPSLGNLFGGNDKSHFRYSKNNRIWPQENKVFMANGQVWEQTDGNKVRIPKVRNEELNTADISKASLGSFFLRVNGKGAAIRVRRVR